MKSKIERKLASIENLESELASIEGLESELQMAKAVQRKLVAENESLDKQLAATNVEADSLETEKSLKRSVMRRFLRRLSRWERLCRRK